MSLYKSFKVMSALGLITSLCSTAWAIDRTVYFTGTSINNYAYDATADYNMAQDVALICSVQVINMSSTRQTITDMGMYNHTTFYDNTNSTAGNYVYGTDLRGNGHLAKTSRDTSEFNVGYVKVTLDSGAANWSRYGNDTSAAYTATKFGVNGTLSGVGTISLEPNTMVYFIARSHALGQAFTNTLDALAVKERKLYNFCTGYIKVRDNPAAAQPKNGFLMATGFSEYIADTPVAKTMWYGELSSNTISALFDVASYAKATGQGRYWQKVSHNRDLAGAGDTGHSHGRCDILVGVQLEANVKCNASHLTNNYSWNSVPQHIASIPIVINSGKPF